jgi:hypothetical protein
MSESNYSEPSQPKSRKFKWFVWFPYPSSWLNALALSVMLSAILCIVRITGITGRAVAVFLNSPEIFAVFGIIALLSPIATIAFAHHWLHLLLSKLATTIQSPEIGKTQGLIPGLISWWVGLYGWLVIAISILVSFSICTIILLMFDLNYAKITYSSTQAETHIQSTFGILCIIVSAFIYQIEYLFKQRLISAKTAIDKSNRVQLNPNSPEPEAELNKIKTELGLNQVNKSKQQT